MMKLALAILVGMVASAFAGPIVDLPVIPRTAIVPPVGKRKDPLLQIASVHVIAQTPLVTAQINQAIDDDAQVTGLLSNHAGAQESDPHGKITCEIGYATSVFVSWACRYEFEATSAGGSQNVEPMGDAMIIENGQAKHAGFTVLFGAEEEARQKVAALTGTGGPPGGCHPADLERGAIFVKPDGIEFNGAMSQGACLVAWDDIRPLLAPRSVLVAVQAHTRAKQPRDPSVDWANHQDRFASDGDLVHDRLTGFDWAARDNGADITWADATAFATAFRGGGHADWRLPREGELLALVEIAGPTHKDRTDCTKGKNALLITALVHLSCGLAWSSASDGETAVAMGFISGTPRRSKLTDKTNLRALVVRGASR